MPTWLFQVFILLGLAVIAAAIYSVRDVLERVASQLGGVNAKLDELCGSERDRKKALRAADEPSEWDRIAK